MSHTAHMMTRMVEAGYLLRALDDLGLRYQVIGGEEEGEPPAVVKVKRGLIGSVVLSRGAAGYSAAGAEMSQRRLRVFVEPIAQRYAYLATVDKLGALGFEVASEEAGASGEVHLTLRRTA